MQAENDSLREKLRRKKQDITSMSKVGFVLDTNLNEFVIKIFSSSELYQKEKRILEILQGKEHIIPIIQTFEENEYCAILFEKYSVDFVPKNDSERIIYMSSILKALSHCHKNFIIHRDVKPDNILYRRGATLEIYLTDFHCSSLNPEEENAEGEYAGTIPYTSPEITQKPSRSYPESDIWSAGLVFCEVLFGIKVFRDVKERRDLALKISDFKKNRFEIFNHPTEGLELWKKAKDLLENMLVVNHEKRFSADQCLQHEIFKK